MRAPGSREPGACDVRGLLTIGEAAERYWVPRRTMFKRLKAANETIPGLLVHFAEPGKRVGTWFVRESRLRRLIEGDD